MQTVLRDPLTWLALAVSTGGALLLSWSFPLNGPLLGAVWGIAAALTALWVGLAAGSGRYQRRRQAAASVEGRAWAERQSRRVDALKLAFTRLDHLPGADALEDLTRGYTAFGTALKMRPPGSEAEAKRWSAAGRGAYDAGLTVLEDLSVVLNTLETAGRSAGSDPRAGGLLDQTKARGETLLAAATALTDGKPSTLPEAAARLEAQGDAASARRAGPGNTG